MNEEQDITEVLDAIIWGRRIVEVKDEIDEVQVFVFQPLTVEERNMGNYVRQKAEREAIEQGTLTRDQLVKQAIKLELWKPSYDADLKSLRSELAIELEALRKEEADKMLDSKGRPKRKTPTAKFLRLEKKVEKITETIKQLEEDYSRYIELPSAEHHAACKQGDYLLQRATLSFPEMNKRWDSLKALKEEQDTVLVANLMRRFYDDSIVDESTIRKVARNGFWRCKWSAAKKNRGVKTLFGREMYDLTLDQFRLVYWSQVYDSAFESLEAPSDRVIEDDKLFDQWLKEQYEKRDQERRKSEFDKKLKDNKRADAHEIGFSVQGEYCQECTCGIKDAAESRGPEKLGHIHAPSCPYGVFIYYNEQKKMQKVEEVQSANPTNIRKILAREQDTLARLGPDGIEEQKLRGADTRGAMGLPTKTHGPGQYGKN